MATIFALDSSAKAASVAIVREGVLLGEQFLNVGLTHSQTLMPMTQALFTQTGMTPADIDLFAVAAGPGSFTGVRIGVAQIKGMAMALGKPCVPVSTLLAMCYNLGLAGDEILCPVMDARCGQVYNALFEVKKGSPVRLSNDRAIAADALFAEISETFPPKTVILMGDGAEWSDKPPPCVNLFSPPTSVRMQRASGVALAAQNHQGIDAAARRPFYLRPPQAERQLKLKHKENE